MKKALAFAGVQLTLVLSAFGWGHEGHEAVADVALKHLNPAANTAITAILNSGEIPEITTLSNAATWPDDIKDGVPPYRGRCWDTVAAKSFKTRFPDHTKWHYVNYPLEGVSYSLSGAFSKPNDIVHQINLCIDVLEGPSGGTLNKSEALAFLVHLVGDLHQPLHVACGYYSLGTHNEVTLTKSPAMPHDACHERGGNGLWWVSGSTTNNLHSFWDANLVSANGSTEAKLVTRLDANLQVLNLPVDTGAIRGWAAKWANDSISKADLIYFDATNEVGTPGTDSDDPAQCTVKVKIPISTGTYRLNHKQDAKDQMTKAAFHLAELLNNIQWN